MVVMVVQLLTILKPTKYNTLRDDVEYIYTTLNPEDAGDKKYYLYEEKFIKMITPIH